MQSTGQTLAALENLQQQQGNLTAQQVAAYQTAYNGYITAQAAAKQASVAASIAPSTIAQQQSQAGLNTTQSTLAQNAAKTGSNGLTVSSTPVASLMLGNNNGGLQAGTGSIQ
jgi:hypothetical protein